jgi:hypothetical protein
MKMGRRLRCSSVTYRFRYAPLLPRVRLGPPCRRPILIVTKAMLFMGQDTRLVFGKQCHEGAIHAVTRGQDIPSAHQP